MDSHKRNHLDDLADDDDDANNSNTTSTNPLRPTAAPPPVPSLASDFSHRMTQVRIGGHHADRTASHTTQKPPIPTPVSTTTATATTTTSATGTAADTLSSSSAPSSVPDPAAPAASNSGAKISTATAASKPPPGAPLTSSASAKPPATAKTATKPTTLSGASAPSSRAAAGTGAASDGSGSGVKVPPAVSKAGSTTGVASRKAPPAPAVGELTRFTSGSTQGSFPAYPNNPVLSAVSVPFSEQFPVKDAQVGPHHFKRLTLLGRGGIGQVYLVNLRSTDKFYAMKVLTKEDMIQRNKVKRVMTEREILATANHPFIVTMYASFQTADRLCFVMEYCAGGEFFRVLQDQPKKRLKEEAVRFYAAEVILALEYLHHMGFIYRDLKPENILMRENGHIALTDFDLSKQAHSVPPRVIQAQLSFSEKLKKSLSMKRNNSSLTNLEIVDSEPVLPYQTNSFVGTEEYIAPEVVNGEGQSSAVDWWTLGILIYEMLTGTTPFKGNGTDETFNNIVKEQLKWPDDITVSTECKQLVKKLLRREADKRLGAENGASDIKRSKWFKDFNFALIRNEKPPIKPKCKDLKTIKASLATDDRDRDRDRILQSGDSSSADILNNDPENPFANFDIIRNASLQRQY